MRLMPLIITAGLLLGGCATQQSNRELTGLAAAQAAHAKRVSRLCHAEATPGTAEYSECMAKHDDPDSYQRREYEQAAAQRRARQQALDERRARTAAILEIMESMQPAPQPVQPVPQFGPTTIDCIEGFSTITCTMY